MVSRGQMSRPITGAHYGLGGWLVQRVSAAIMAIYTVILFGVFIVHPPNTYVAWRSLFANGWMRAATLLFLLSLVAHAWVGMRDILMDYIKPTGLRLTLEVLVILTLVIYAAWSVQILWRT
jgi:succinate dehydrogenase / fumarate reductase membrane anchor subunit